MNFTNKTVLITGASRGIGEATARNFARRGADLIITYNRDEAAARNIIDSLPGDQHACIQLSIENPKSIQMVVEQVMEAFGKIDILINNAGVYETHPIVETDYQQWQNAWQRTLGVNLIGPANLCYQVVPHMIAQGGGRIVNVSSRGAFRGEPQQPAYGASKAGLNAMSQSLSQALAPHNIFISVVAPGFVETDMAKEILEGPEGEGIKNQSPLGRVATPEEVAHGIVFLASEEAAFMTGAILDINGASYFR